MKKQAETINLQSQIDTMTFFNALLLSEKEMKTKEGNEYYNLLEILKSKLAEFLRKDFSILNTRQLLKLCSMVGSYRPVALHTFLIYCSQLIND